jgi:hypothetical protein
MYSEKHPPGYCVWCGEYVEDRREDSGGATRDWAAVDSKGHGDFGCNKSPETCDEGVGSHARPNDLRQFYDFLQVTTDLVEYCRDRKGQVDHYLHLIVDKAIAALTEWEKQRV